MSSRITIKLAEIPRLLRAEYHPDQVLLYSKFSELTFKALNLPSVIEFMEKLAVSLGVGKVEVLLNRLPPRRSRMGLVEKEGKIHIVGEELHGISRKDTPLIIVFPGLLWPKKDAKPYWRVGIRGHILNSTIRALIHEMLHQSGVHDEAEAKRLADQHYKEFRRTYLSRFEEEFKPILKEWKNVERGLGQGRSLEHTEKHRSQ